MERFKCLRFHYEEEDAILGYIGCKIVDLSFDFPKKVNHEGYLSCRGMSKEVVMLSALYMAHNMQITNVKNRHLQQDKNSSSITFH